MAKRQQFSCAPRVVINGPSFFSRFAEISRKREPNAAGLIIIFHEVPTLVHLIESSKTRGARGGYPLDRAAGGALTPRGATVPRERSYRQPVARQSRPRQENSWRFRVDLAYVGESALSTGQRELS